MGDVVRRLVVRKVECWDAEVRFEKLSVVTAVLCSRRIGSALEWRALQTLPCFTAARAAVLPKTPRWHGNMFTPPTVALSQSPPTSGSLRTTPAVTSQV